MGKIDKFLEKLKAFKGKFHLHGDGSMRCRTGRCPIIAVLDLESGNGYARDLAVIAKLLTSNQAAAVMNAADGDQTPLRKRMLDVLGLAEKKTR